MNDHFQSAVCIPAFTVRICCAEEGQGCGLNGEEEEEKEGLGFRVKDTSFWQPHNVVGIVGAMSRSVLHNIRCGFKQDW